MSSSVTMICSTWATDTLNTCFSWPAGSEALYSISSSLTRETSVFSSLGSIPQISSSSSVAAPESSTSSSDSDALSDIGRDTVTGAKTLLIIVTIVETVVAVGDMSAVNGGHGSWQDEDSRGGKHGNGGSGRDGA